LPPPLEDKVEKQPTKTEKDPPVTYWLGRQPDAAKNEFVFDVPVPADLASLLTDDRPDYAARGFQRSQWEIGDKVHVVIHTRLGWNNDSIERGRVTRNWTNTRNWTSVSVKSPEWPACKEALKAQASGDEWQDVRPRLLEARGRDNPKLKIDFDADRPFDVRRDAVEYDSSIDLWAVTKKPQIVPVVHGGDLYVAWHAWRGERPGDRVFVAKIAADHLDKGRMKAVRQAPSGGTLVGFAVDDEGDYLITARTEKPPNDVKGNFVEEVHETYRKGVVSLSAKSAVTDLNSKKFTDLPFYGLANSGTGRMLAVGGRLAAVFARRQYSPRDKLIHQRADALLMDRDRGAVHVKPTNRVSHSFDQRLIFDGDGKYREVERRLPK
jgi:hypothetical protein